MPSAIFAAEVEHDDVVAHAHHEVHVVLDEQDGDAPVVGEAADEVRQLGGLGVAEPGGGLVEEQHAGLRGDGAGDGEQPPLAVGEVLDLAQQVGLEPELLDRGDDGAGHRRLARPDEIGQVGEAVARVVGRPQVVEHGRVLEQLERLERAATRRRGRAWRRTST